MKPPTVEQFQRLLPPSSTSFEFLFNDRRINLEVRNWGGSYSISFSIPSGNQWRLSRLLTGVESAKELCGIWSSFLEHPEQYLDPEWHKKMR
jgi:hypothetical protein